MRMIRMMIATSMCVGLATGAALAGGGSGSGSAAPAGGGSGSAAAKPAPMPMPKPADELLAAQKAMGGSWKCTGTVNMPDPMPVTATITGKADLDKMWWHESLVETKSKTPYKFEAYMTYDGKAKKWMHVAVDNMGGMESTTSDDMNTWTGTSSGMGMSSKVKTVHTQVSDKEFKLEGTMSMDGKTWNPTFTMDCKK
jgi:hypothetical protein